MVNKEIKTGTITLEEYTELVETAYKEVCDSDMHDWSELDFHAGFMAAFNYCSRYKIAHESSLK